MSDEANARKLIAELKGTGLFERYNYKEVMAASLFMIVRAVHLHNKLPGAKCLSVIAEVVQTMRAHEDRHGRARDHAQ